MTSDDESSLGQEENEHPFFTAKRSDLQVKSQEFKRKDAKSGLASSDIPRLERHWLWAQSSSAVRNAWASRRRSHRPTRQATNHGVSNRSRWIDGLLVQAARRYATRLRRLDADVGRTSAAKRTSGWAVRAGQPTPRSREAASLGTRTVLIGPRISNGLGVLPQALRFQGSRPTAPNRSGRCPWPFGPFAMPDSMAAPRS